MARSKKKLNIGCNDADCKSGLHCFKATDEMVAINKTGRCRECGVDLIDWPRVHQRNVNDVQNTFFSLKKEKVRHYFWHRELGQKAINHAKRKGRSGLRQRVRKHLETCIAPSAPWHDGFQTPMTDIPANAFAYGQHATATCCRKCLEYWHGIPQGVRVTAPDLDYLTELVCLYIEDRIPDLTENGINVPPIRKGRPK
jgi:hypothetical protein